MNTRENLDKYENAYNNEFKYNDENSWFLTRYAEIIIQSIRDNNYNSIVSLGVGHNIVSDILTKELDHSVEKYVILEGSKSIIDKFEVLPKNQNKINLINTYFEDYESSEKFDVIEMGFILEHVDNPSLILEKFKNYLTDNGKMFISVPNAKSLHRLIGQEAGLLDSVYTLSEYDKQLGHKRYFDLDSISNLTLKAGLKIVNKRGLFLKPITTNQIQKLGWTKEIIDSLMKIGDSYPDISNCILIEAKL